MTPPALPVLVAGAGPAGLAAAITLARHGVPVLLVERRAAPSPWPRATAVSTGSMELLRSWGLADAVRARAADVEWRYWMCETLAAAAGGRAYPTGLPTREQSAIISPVAPACIPQDELETVLLAHARSLPGLRFEAGLEVTGVTNRGDGVAVVVRAPATGAQRTVQARYVIAADGAHSAIRTALGIAMRGPDRLAERVTALIRAPLADVVGEHRYVIYGVAHPRETNAFLPAGRGDRWVFATDWDPRRERAEDFTEDILAGFIARGAGVPGLRPRFEHIGRVRFAAQLADRFRAGATFLIGDAAHRVSPRGGTGMNTAIRDGADLGWKLAWVLRGWAGADLLDTYEAERRPVAEHNVARSATPDGTWRDADQELHADLGGRIAHHWLPAADGARVSTLDLLGLGLTLLTGPRGTDWAAAAAGMPGPLPIAVHALDAVSARALGVRGDGALLVRPDGSPAAWWPHGADARPALRAAVEVLVGGTVARAA